MKYVTPKYEKAVIEAKDALLASFGGFEISKSDTGEGKIQLEFSKLFGNF